MDPFNRLEALIETGGVDAVDQARALLNSFAGSTEIGTQAVDEFLIDMMTLSFLAESGRESLQISVRRLARLRLSRVKLLLGVTSRQIRQF
ncbi:hypothetical protein EOA27_00515 [Mesorhizobium sp. M2A.F.Ca.ET.037.01.1.1]|uniref:hypothetical protein n=1 Tax=unclassified Mesorhizobium TaxID=325217 RepID=UPI000F75C575|nr:MULTISPECIES: hypothetical protein [unclassified Mesorhizobium]RUY13121.1 hypothetical protein EOA25_01445 [Mesorhizobium sp. M2A.F.Ca.ET.040.01.1.1]AZO16058.1 hypothetical protein EJ069_15845 [Mesorhizobium sp. M2A.F.Ca.ET.043.05.1.1]RUX23388.1 hypothetical protein EOA27_00515 [Mesorhizobium sp. M2A.F.Ca.ET.037.01.1.1]RWA89225.1 MAG: hypothetical protein EOQ31_18555 [Mesorhizobium sp.]RWE85350.1 MAG: hypothetical protein EOS63_01560 [Mesorhizobium sp.]